MLTLSLALIVSLAMVFYFRIKTEQLQKMFVEAQGMLACGDVAGKVSHYVKMCRLIDERDNTLKVFIVVDVLLVLAYIATLVV